MPIVYKLDFPTGKAYIGITRGALPDRLKGHRYDANRGSKCALHKAWRKYGEPVARVLAVVEEHVLLDTEIKAIATFKTLKPYGYNLTPGGEASPALMPEVAAKISAAAKGRYVSPETRARMVDAARRALASPEVRARMSAARKGRVVPESARAKMRAAMTGRVLTDEHRAKLKEARNRRGPASAETRARMSASHKARFEKKGD